jgi:hypothetical protein
MAIEPSTTQLVVQVFAESKTKHCEQAQAKKRECSQKQFHYDIKIHGKLLSKGLDARLNHH